MCTCPVIVRLMRSIRESLEQQRGVSSPDNFLPQFFYLCDVVYAIRQGVTAALVRNDNKISAMYVSPKVKSMAFNIVNNVKT